MYKGIFIGENARNREKRILIMGESHHWDDEDAELDELGKKHKEENYHTADVIKRYLKNYKDYAGKDRCVNYRFFDNIVNSFNIDPEKERENFWNQVYFGNYVEELCGVGDSRAQCAIRKNRDLYNTNLFQFINDEHIDYVFCYSFLTYYNLPSCNINSGDMEIKDKKLDSKFVRCNYKKGSKKHCATALNHDITVYKIHHPSRGFSYNTYAQVIAEETEREGLILK